MHASFCNILLCAGKSSVPLLGVERVWLQLRILKITIMQDILHPVLCVLESTPHHVCSAYMYPKLMILSFRQKLLVAMTW